MKFLIIRLSSLGDIIHTLPILNALRKSYPNAQIDWLTGKKGLDILSLIKEIDNLHLISFNSLKKIQKEKYDYIIDAQGLLKTALIGKFCFGKQVIGFKNTRECADLFYDKKIDVGNLFKTDKHIVDLNLKLVEDLTQESKAKFLIPKIEDSKITQSPTDSKKKSALIFPSTTWESKHWVDEYWIKLIKDLQHKYVISLLAAKSEQQKLSNMVHTLNTEKITFNNLIGKTNIKDLIHLIQKSDLVIGLDSAGIHLASAIKNDYGSPNVIGIYGPTSVKRNGTYNAIENCVYLDLECMPCKKKICPLKHHKCMKDLTPSRMHELIS